MIALAPSRLGRPPARAAGVRPRWTALVAVVVLGIIGMHAIGLHGSQHADPGGLAAPSAMPAMPDARDAIPARTVRPTGAVMGQGRAALVSPAGPRARMAGMAMLCIAVLVGGALAQMLIRSHRGSRVPRANV